MKHCPNPDCPYARRHRRAQEYLDTAEMCSDCHTALEPGDAPEPAVRPEEEAASHLWKRLAVTLSAPIAVGLAGWLPIPGIDGTALSPLGTLPHGVVSVVSLGLGPFIAGSIITEIACLVVPSWRVMRTGTLDHRARIRRAWVVVSLAIATVQAIGVSFALQNAGLVARPGVATHLVVTPTLVAGTFGLLGLTRAVDRWGLGNGFSVLLAGGLATGLGQLLWSLGERLGRGELAPTHLLLLGGAILVVIAATVRTSRIVAVSGTHPTATFRVPASGALPITDAAALLALLPSLQALRVPGFDWLAEALGPGSSLFYAAQTGIALMLVVVFAVLFNRPSKVAVLLARLRGTALEAERERAAGLLRRALPRSALYVLVLSACGMVATSAISLGAALDVVGVAVMTAVVLDMITEWRARRETDDLVAVWEEHRVYACDTAIEALHEGEVPVFVRGLHHRVLMQFFGPFVPMQLFVPRERKADGEAILHEILLGAPAKEEEDEARLVNAERGTGNAE